MAKNKLVTYRQFDDIHNTEVLEFRYRISREEADTEYRYWFSTNKFENMNIKNVEAALLDNRIISVSCCSLLDNDTLRVAQLHYTLFDYRQKYRDLLITESGFLDRHLQTAKKLNANKMLIAIHPFSKKTQKVLDIYLNRRDRYRWLKEFDYTGIKTLNNVEQHCFEYRY